MTYGGRMGYCRRCDLRNSEHECPSVRAYERECAELVERMADQTPRLWWVEEARALLRKHGKLP